MRARLRQDMGPRASSWGDMWLTNFRRPANHRFEGRSILQVADMLDRDPVDAVCDLLVDEALEVSYVSAGGNLATLPKFVSHPLSMVGSDALLIGDYPSPRTYGCFPIILAEFVREERFLALPDAIRKMTSFPAQRLGLPDRGLLARRLQGRRGGVRRQDGEGAGHAHPAQAVPDRDRPRDRQRPGGHRRGTAYRRARRARAPPRPRVDVAGRRRATPAGAASGHRLLMRLLEVAGLTKRVAGRVALDAVSFTVEEGEIFGVLGPRAAGKTTCLDCLSGLLAPDEGRVLFDGRDVTAERRGRMSRLGVARTLARDEPLPAHGVIDDVRRALGRAGARSLWLLPRWWRGRQRARLLLIDEPLRGLGPDEIPVITELFATLRGEGLTLVVAERRLADAPALVDRAVVIARGLVVAEGPPARLAGEPRVIEAFRPRAP